MIIPFILALALLLFSLRLCPEGYAGYIDREQTQAINGFFIMIVFLRHFSQYLPMESTLDTLFQYTQVLLTQMIVTTFMFYSGYGVMISILRKGEAYVRAMPRRRILKTLILFDAAILLYAVLDLVLGIEITVPQVLLSLIGWSGLGNSNWYVFAILMMYLLTYLAFAFTRQRRHGLYLATGLIVLYIILVSRWREPRFYNTTLCYAAGLWFAFYRERIDAALSQKRQYRRWLCMSMVLFLIFFASHFASVMALHGAGSFARFVIPFSDYHQLLFLTFTAVVVLLSMKVKISSPVLTWCGENLLGLFILQRLPMILFGQSEWMISHEFVYLLICLVLTVLLTIGYRKLVIEKVKL